MGMFSYPKVSHTSKGFSLVELLISLAIAVALAGVSIAVYGQYTQRAYLISALTQVVGMETALQAATTDNVSLGSSLYTEARSFLYQIDGTLTCVTGCDGIDENILFPGLNHQRGIKLTLVTADTGSHSITGAHCKNVLGTDYQSYFLQAGSTPILVSWPVGAEAEDCEAVLDGGIVDGGDSGPVCGNGAMEGSEECDDGNTASDDGCSSACAVEVGGDDCGNSVVDGSEECDDGNEVDYDGCSPTCETTITCTAENWGDYPNVISECASVGGTLQEGCGCACPNSNHIYDYVAVNCGCMNLWQEGDCQSSDNGPAGTWNNENCSCECPEGSSFGGLYCTCNAPHVYVNGSCGCMDTLKNNCEGFFSGIAGTFDDTSCECTSCPEDSQLSGGMCWCNDPYINNGDGSCRCNDSLEAFCEGSATGIVGTYDNTNCTCVSCPGNSTLNSGYCTCESGTWDGSNCV